MQNLRAVRTRRHQNSSGRNKLFIDASPTRASQGIVTTANDIVAYHHNVPVQLLVASASLKVRVGPHGCTKVSRIQLLVCTNGDPVLVQNRRKQHWKSDSVPNQANVAPWLHSLLQTSRLCKPRQLGVTRRPVTIQNSLTHLITPNRRIRVQDPHAVGIQGAVEYGQHAPHKAEV